MTAMWSPGTLTTSQPSTAVSIALDGLWRSRHRLPPHIELDGPVGASGGDVSPPGSGPGPGPGLGHPTSALAAVTARPCSTKRREQPSHGAPAGGTTRSDIAW